MEKTLSFRARGRRSGFTLVELLIVIVIIGILASIATVRYQGVRERAYRRAVESDIQNLVKHQELYYIDHTSYGLLEDMNQYVSSPGVNMAVNYAAVDGWAAAADHDAMEGFSCGYMYGTAPAGSAGPATAPEVLTCAQD